MRPMNFKKFPAPPNDPYPEIITDQGLKIHIKTCLKYIIWRRKHDKWFNGMLNSIKETAPDNYPGETKNS